MKKNIFTIIGIIAIFACTNVAKANKYVWIHGLNDNSDCWSLYNKDASIGNNKGTLVSYNPSSTTSINGIATRVINNNSDLNSGYEPTILIGHSLGGLVAREIESNNSSINYKVKGIITVGTPHQGARVLSNLNKGQLNAVASKLYDKTSWVATSASQALLSILGPIGKSLSYVVTFIDVSGILKTKLTTTYIFPAIETQLAGYNVDDQFVKDMKVGSPYMSTISNRKVNVPILTFACEEDRLALPRVGYCAVNKTTLQKENVNSDGKFEEKSGSYLDITKKVKTASYFASAVTCGIGALTASLVWSNPGWAYTSIMNFKASAQAVDLGWYIDNGMDFDHAVFVGASHVDEIATNHKFLWKRWTTYKYVTVPEAHDGVVPVKSQFMNQSAGTNVIIPNHTIKGVNHLEEFNHKNTKTEFIQTFAGTSPYGQTFKR
jgi:hypothetical protein